MAGNIEKISNYIFIVTPESIEISGDIQEVISSGIRIPAFHNDNYQGVNLLIDYLVSVAYWF